MHDIIVITWYREFYVISVLRTHTHTLNEHLSRKMKVPRNLAIVVESAAICLESKVLMVTVPFWAKCAQTSGNMFKKFNNIYAEVRAERAQLSKIHIKLRSREEHVRKRTHYHHRTLPCTGEKFCFCFKSALIWKKTLQCATVLKKIW